MPTFGYFLSSEEHGANALVRQAQLAEDAGMESVWISDHFHPWLHSQGESPFVWSTIGGIAASTRLRVTTAVTCPTVRVHPAVVAQAAATSATMLEGRFNLGVGTGENLNEHVLGDHWPPAMVRLEMLEEAIEVMRKLWTGDEVTHHGRHYTVENARIFSVPDQPVPVLISGFGPKATDLAARIGDGYINTSPDAELLTRYRDGGGKGPTMAGVKVCWGDDEQTCVKRAHETWRSSGVPGQLSQDLQTPEHFEMASELVTPEMIGEKIPCGPDPERHASVIRKYVEAGFDEIYISQIGPEQEGFFDFYRRELGPLLPA
jgi:G6PDH family F420-dependent oxidoreductase